MSSGHDDLLFFSLLLFFTIVFLTTASNDFFYSSLSGTNCTTKCPDDGILISEMARTLEAKKYKKECMHHGL